MAAIAGRTEQGAFARGKGGLAGMLQGGDEIRLGDLLLVADHQLTQRGRGDPDEYPDNDQHHDLLDQGRALLGEAKPDMLPQGHGVAPAVPGRSILETLAGRAQPLNDDNTVGLC